SHELGDGKSRGKHASDDAVDLFLDEVEHLLVGEGQSEEQLPPVQVMDDMHRLEHAARADLAMTLGGRDEQKLFGGGLLDGLGDGKLEMSPEVADGLALEVLHPLAVFGVVGVELLRDDELACLFGRGEVQAVP